LGARAATLSAGCGEEHPVSEAFKSVATNVIAHLSRVPDETHAG
jgi:hypothetical protein